MDGGEVAKSGTFPPPHLKIVGGKYPPHLRASWGGNFPPMVGGKRRRRKFWILAPPMVGGKHQISALSPHPWGGSTKISGQKAPQAKILGIFPPPMGGNRNFRKVLPPHLRASWGGSFWDLAPWGGVGMSWGGSEKVLPPHPWGGNKQPWHEHELENSSGSKKQK